MIRAARAFTWLMELLSRTTNFDPSSRGTRETNSPSSASACAEALLEALPGVMWFVRRQMRSRRAEGLSVPQFRALVHLHRCPKASLLDVAEKLGSSVPTVSRIVSRLVTHGWVERQTCPQDRRRAALHLTARGQATLTAAWTGTQAAMAARLAHLTEPDRAALLRTFVLLSELFGRAAPPTPAAEPPRVS